MANGYKRSPKLLKGAFVELGEDPSNPAVNIITFQYNPETMTRSLIPYSEKESGQGRKNKKAEPFDPDETIDLTLVVDAADELEEPEQHPETVKTGVSDRIAAVEMLMYPISDNISIEEDIERTNIPVLLFVWGQGRILPVQITSFRVEEEAFSPTLFPIRAKVTVGLKVITEPALKSTGRKLSESEKMAVTAYKLNLKNKDELAASYRTDNDDTNLGLLPF